MPSPISIGFISCFNFLDCKSKVEDGRCEKISGQCWCLHNSGTPGHKACGYPHGYNGTYYSIASDSDPSPWTIIKGLGRKPWSAVCYADNKNGCNGNAALNFCHVPNGCYGTSLQTWTNQKRWSHSYKRPHASRYYGIVRCRNMEG